MSLPLQIIGQASCPEAKERGYDADEARANLLSNGKILCISCGKIHEGLPDHRKRATSRLLERTYEILKVCGEGPHLLKGSPMANNPDAHRVPEFDPQNPDKLLISRYAASCLCGYDPNTFPSVRALFRGERVTAELSYFADELERALVPDLDYDEPLDAEEQHRMPPVVVGVITKLQAELGFRVRGSKASREEYRDALTPGVRLACGTKVGLMGYISGLSLLLSWNRASV